MADSDDPTRSRRLIAPPVAGDALLYEPRLAFADTPDGPWTEVTGAFSNESASLSVAAPTRWTRFTFEKTREG